MIQIWFSGSNCWNCQVSKWIGGIWSAELRDSSNLWVDFPTTASRTWFDTWKWPGSCHSMRFSPWWMQLSTVAGRPHHILRSRWRQPKIWRQQLLESCGTPVPHHVMWDIPQHVGKFHSSSYIDSNRWIVKYSYWLVVWNINFIFLYMGNFIIPIDFHIFQRGGPTTNQM